MFPECPPCFKALNCQSGAKLRCIRLDVAIIWTTGMIFMESHQEKPFFPEPDWGMNTDERTADLD